MGRCMRVGLRARGKKTHSRKEKWVEKREREKGRGQKEETWGEKRKRVSDQKETRERGDGKAPRVSKNESKPKVKETTLRRSGLEQRDCVISRAAETLRVGATRRRRG